VYVHLLHLHSPLKDVARVDPRAPLAEPAPPPVVAGESEAERRDAEERWRIAKIVADMTQITNALREKQKKDVGDLKQAALEVGLAVAERLIHEALDRGAFGVEKLVEEAVAKLGSPQEFNLYLHPEDIALLEKRLGGDRRLFAEGGGVRIVADASVSRGSCRAEAGDVLVASDLKTHLAEVRRHLLGESQTL
jgi:flagellar biosynthesis/type III secretory pathway protein FliH